MDYRALLKKVDEMAEAIERTGESDVIHDVVETIIQRFRGQLGLYGGRVYRREGDSYLLQDTFGEAKEVPRGLKVPRSYPALALCCEQGTVYMEAEDPRSDRELERELGVREFACFEAGSCEYIVAFNVEPEVDREDILFSLGILRHSVNKKLLQRRMDGLYRQSKLIHSSILPRESPDFQSYDIAGRIETVESVGGDYFSYLPISDKVLGLALADVSGHGLPAALQVRDVHTGLRMGLGRDFKLSRTVERLNGIIHESTLSSRFVALVYGELERNGTFVYVNAGHIAPFLLRADGRCDFLEDGGPVLGPLADATYERGFVTLRPGDLLVLATDGIIETRRKADGEDSWEDFGMDRLKEVVKRHRSESASAIIDAVFAAIDEFGGGAPSEDDRTMMVVRYPGEEG